MIEFHQAPAEARPFADASFDTVVASLVPCTVGDQSRSLTEVRRVLKPGGTFRFIEHVRAEGEPLGRLQDLLTPLWRRIGAGCPRVFPSSRGLPGSQGEPRGACYEPPAPTPPPMGRARMRLPPRSRGAGDSIVEPRAIIHSHVVPCSIAILSATMAPIPCGTVTRRGSTGVLDDRRAGDQPFRPSRASARCWASSKPRTRSSSWRARPMRARCL